MDLAERLAVGSSDDAGEDLWLARDLPLDPGQHVHVAVQDEVVAALPEGMHVSVLVDGSSQAGDDERGERGGLPGPYLRVPQVRASLGHIDFEQAMHPAPCAADVFAASARRTRRLWSTRTGRWSR